MSDRHAGVDPEAPGAVGGGLHHAALVPPAADHEQLDVAELGVILSADLHEEGVEIHVNDPGGHARLDSDQEAGQTGVNEHR